MKAIEVKHVSYNTKTFQIKDLSFSIPQGFVTGFIGSNGAQDNNDSINDGFA